MKKLLSIVLAIMMMLTMCVSVSAAELRDDAPPTDVDVMPNGSFEELDENGQPVSIVPYGGWEAGIVSLTDEEAHSGEHSIKIAPQKGDYQHPWIRAEFTGDKIIGGSTVEVSLWYKGTFADDATMGVKFEGYTGLQIRSDYCSENVEYYNWDASSNWTKLTMKHTLKPNTQLAVLYLRLFNAVEGGTVYIDDVTFKMIELPELSFEFETDNVFYYTDTEQTTGYAQVEMNQYFKDDGYTADFELLDGSTVIESYSGEFVDNVTRFEYPLSLIAEKEKEYKVTAKVKDPSGAVVEEYLDYVYMYDRPKALDKNGVYTDKNGKNVRPIFMYHMSTFDKKDAWQAASKAGVNVIQWSPPEDVKTARAQLDEMYEMGMYAAVVCYWGMMPAGHDLNVDRVKAYMEQIKDHPAVFCWMIMDEPFINDFYAHDNLRKSYIMLRSIDDHIPTYICEGSWIRLPEAAKYCDIIGPDPYPGGWNSYGTFVPKFIDHALQVADKLERTTVGILQCFTMGHATNDPSIRRKPSPLEAHSMLIQNYLIGAQGHGWYTWEPDSPEEDDRLDLGEYWPMMQAYHDLEADIMYPYFVSGEYENFNEYKPGNVLEETGDVWYETWTDGEVVYGVVQNRRYENMNQDISLSSANGRVVIEDYDFTVIYNGEGSDPVVTKGDGVVNVTLEPHQAFTFKIEPKNDVDFDKLSGLGDMDNYDWAKDAVQFIYDNGIESESADKMFRPGEAITRGEFARFLIRTLDLKVTKPVANFADVDPAANYAKDVAIGRTLGILNGVGEGNYNPESPITRQDLMVICGRGMKFMKPFGAASTDLSGRPDGDKVAGYAVADVAAMIESGIIKGNEDGSINPLGNTTRAEAAVIMQRIHEWKNA